MMGVCRPVIARYLGLALLGVGLGGFGTLIGAGGGFLLVPLLLLLYPSEEPETITSISLAVVAVNSLAGSISYARMKRINYRAGLLFAVATIPGAVLGAFSTGFIPKRTFDLILGVVLLAVAAVLFWKPGASRPGNRGELKEMPACGTGTSGIGRKCWLGMLISFGVGGLSSLLGIGGGIIHVPALVHVLNFPVHNATATSHFVLAIMAITGTMTHVVTGTFHHGVRRAVAIGIGAMIGAPLGAAFSRRVSGRWIIRGLAAALLLVSLRLLWRH